MKRAALRSKRNRHTGRINAAKQVILDATAPLNNKTGGPFREYVVRILGGKLYKGIRTRVNLGNDKHPLVKDTLTLVRSTF